MFPQHTTNGYECNETHTSGKAANIDTLNKTFTFKWTHFQSKRIFCVCNEIQFCNAYAKKMLTLKASKQNMRYKINRGDVVLWCRWRVKWPGFMKKDFLSLKNLLFNLYKIFIYCKDQSGKIDQWCPWQLTDLGQCVLLPSFLYDGFCLIYSWFSLIIICCPLIYGSRCFFKFKFFPNCCYTLSDGESAQPSDEPLPKWHKTYHGAERMTDTSLAKSVPALKTESKSEKYPNVGEIH